jgi:ATP-dependent RNA helicase HelY
VGHLALPTPIRPNHPEFRRVAAKRLRDLADRLPAGADDAEAEDARAELAARIGAHPASADRRLEQRLSAAREADRIEQRVGRLERQLARRSDTLAHQLDRVLEVLRSWGYVEGWALTAAGELLAHVYAESDLLVAESVREGLLDGLRPAELAAVVSAFTYRRRGPEGDQPGPPRAWPSAEVRARVRAIEEIGRDLAVVEEEASLPITAPPDPGLVAAVHAWASGAELGDVLAAEEATGGDFVRNIKQVVDVLQQLAEHMPDPESAATAAEASRLCLRGVVAASTFLR